MCCSALQCVAVRCSVFVQCVAMRCSMVQRVAIFLSPVIGITLPPSPPPFSLAHLKSVVGVSLSLSLALLLSLSLTHILPLDLFLHLSCSPSLALCHALTPPIPAFNSLSLSLSVPPSLVPSPLSELESPNGQCFYDLEHMYIYEYLYIIYIYIHVSFMSHPCVP